MFLLINPYWVRQLKGCRATFFPLPIFIYKMNKLHTLEAFDKIRKNRKTQGKTTRKITLKPITNANILEHILPHFSSSNMPIYIACDIYKCMNINLKTCIEIHSLSYATLYLDTCEYVLNLIIIDMHHFNSI